MRWPSRLSGRNRAFVAETNARLRDAYFDDNRAGLRPDPEAARQFDFELLLGLLAGFPDLQVVVEGHCDERGSAEYNLALGDRRANQAIQYLAPPGLPASKLRPGSYRREHPQCGEPDESCWGKTGARTWCPWCGSRRELTVCDIKSCQGETT